MVLLEAYYQVPVHPTDISKTAIINPIGTCTFNYTCFGLQKAGATFQWMMDGIHGDLDLYICYVNDILTSYKNQAEHQEHLCIILQHLKENSSSSH